MSKKTPSAMDKHIGHRIRLARLSVGVTQEGLADALHLTFQQVQKYEKGTNRIGPANLQIVAQKVGKPVSWFFEGAPGSGNTGTAVTPEFAAAQNAFATREGLRIAAALAKIKNIKMRHNIADLVEGIAEMRA